MSEIEDRLEALATWAASDEPAIRPDAVIERGEAARASARELVAQFSADDPPGAVS
jgi:hypothetical protein